MTKSTVVNFKFIAKFMKEKKYDKRCTSFVTSIEECDIHLSIQNQNFLEVKEKYHIKRVLFSVVQSTHY